MNRRHFLQLSAGVLVEKSFALASHPTAYSLRVTPSGLVVDNCRPGQPICVRAGERVLFHFSNTGVMEDVLLHLPGHRFTVVALDGYPVPTPAAVDVLALAAGERTSAVVEMNTPGNWLLGALDDTLRSRGLSVPLAYNNRNGSAQWHTPPAIDWSYAQFSAAIRSTHQPDESIEMLFEGQQWFVNGRLFPGIESMVLPPGHRYRLRMMNATSRAQPVRLRHYRFELTRVNQIPVAGIFKDTIRLERYNVVEAAYETPAGRGS
jgi:FtsP/CotA-like multicopper oxidase with cupredoxin domain